MSNMSIVLTGWLALNAALPVILLARQPRPRLQHRLFRWVIGDQKPARPRRYVHDLIMAHRHDQ
jgi:hypothetical protein